MFSVAGFSDSSAVLQCSNTSPQLLGERSPQTGASPVVAAGEGELHGSPKSYSAERASSHFGTGSTSKITCEGNFSDR